MKNIFTLITLLLGTLSPLALFSQSWANDNGGVYNIPAEEYNPVYHGYGSTDNRIWNKIDLQNGRKMEIKNPNSSQNSVDLYDSLGNKIDNAWNSPIGRDIGNIEPDGYTFRDGGIIASSIAQIKVGNTNHTMVYAWSVNTQGSGRRSGWIKLTDLTPSTTIKNILEDNKDIRMDLLEDGGINDATYDEYRVVNAFLPSSINEYYLVPGRSASKTAGKARFYYTVQEENGNYISGIKNIPETSRQRFGVAHNNLPIDAKFNVDRNYPVVKVNIYPPSSSVVNSHKLELVWGFTETSAGERIYSFVNRRALVATGKTDVTNNENTPAPAPPTSDQFIPDPNKLYYIDSPAHNTRLAASGYSEAPYMTSIGLANSNTQWKFIPKGNGYWHIQRAGGGSKPRLRTDNTPYADMQETSSSLTYTYFHFPKGKTSGTYFIRLPDGPANYKKLQVRSNGDVKMVSDAGVGTWESFKFTVASSTTSAVKNIAPDGTASQSSTAYGGSAARAIDKNTNGNYHQGSVTHTGITQGAHWKVRWNNDYRIDQVKLYNRTDCCTTRLSNFKVIVKNSGNTVYTRTYTGTPNSTLSVNTGGVIGDEVRIELNGRNYLSLAEVEVTGSPASSLSGRSADLTNTYIRATKEMGRKVALDWRVDSDLTPIQYDIEYSANEGSFELLKTVSADQSEKGNVLDFLHDFPEIGDNTYRVKVVYDDESENYLFSRSINFEATNKSLVFPNPAEDRLFVDLSELMDREIELFLTNSSGAVIMTKELDKDHEEMLELNISAVQNGFHVLYIKPKNRRAIAEKVSILNLY